MSLAVDAPSSKASLASDADVALPDAGRTSAADAPDLQAQSKALASQPTTADVLRQADTPLSALTQQPSQAQVLAQRPASGAASATASTVAGRPADDTVPGPSITGAAQGAADAGDKTLVDNPRLSVQWESTRSAWTREVGFTPRLTDLLHEQRLTINPPNLSPAPGSFGKTSGLSASQANPRNGTAADIAIEKRLQSQGYQTARQVDVGNGRRVDVVGSKVNANPRLNERVEIESKAYRADASQRNGLEAVRDGKRLATNVNLRASGNLLEGVGRVARPVGLVLDAVEVGSAFKADDNRIGENTGRAVSGLAGGAAGGWGGAMAGAAIGTAILPGVGTVVGGLIGGIGGALLGDGAARRSFDTVRSWF